MSHLTLFIYLFGILQGLCPGNRLRILNSYDSGCFSPSPASSPCPSLAASTATLNSSICSADIYENTSIISGSGSSANGSGSGYISASQTNITTTSSTCCPTAVTTSNLQQTQRQGTRRSWHVSPNKVSFCLPTALHNKLICEKKTEQLQRARRIQNKKCCRKKITGFFFVMFLYVVATVKWKNFFISRLVCICLVCYFWKSSGGVSAFYLSWHLCSHHIIVTNYNRYESPDLFFFFKYF